LTETPFGLEEFGRLVTELRPKLHSHCARMTGSVIDGEDVLQEALLRATEALSENGPLTNPAGWLFRIAHNAALDHLRRRARQGEHVGEGFEMIADPVNRIDDRLVVGASLRTFMRLPVAQRSSVILKDVFGYSLEEVGEVMGFTVQAAKSALQRGRIRLRELADEPEDVAPPSLAEYERSRLLDYVDRFNARDFDTIRDMLADDVRLDLVNRTQAGGRGAVGKYFHNYSHIHDWRLIAGFVDRRPAILVVDPEDPEGPPAYFVLVNWAANGIAGIRDFRFARYAIKDAEIWTFK